MLNKIIKYFLENRVITLLLLVALIIWGLSTAPFNWQAGVLPRDPVPVDAIPDYGENQQIVATEWMGRSPKDIQDQITYPLTTSLLGISGVKTIRSTSMFGMSFTKAFSQVLDPMLPHLDRYSGTHWKDEIPRPGNLLEDGIPMSSGRFRIFMSAIRFRPLMAFPRLLPLEVL